ncbi:MAG TPA: NAD(P)-binding domain-containing protein [Candidatus Sulfotelmatobacter sp.]|nr:NAD(P)-binding domain-containing protein [Candidatus Sulfotelmatobacter sp.]
MNNLIGLLVAFTITLFFVRRYLKEQERQAELAKEAQKKGSLRSDGPQSQHPHIDNQYCIGCATCTAVCPEGDVLAMLGGQAVIVNGYKCIGHSLCAEVCPVGAITMVMASPSVGADLPQLSPEFETSVPNMFIVGELGGLALIKNAINQGRDCADTIAKRIPTLKNGSSSHDVLDLLIVGAGPAGISASLRAIEKKLKYLTVDEGDIGGTVSKYPRQKLVLTSPVELPVYGKFKKTELSKEDLLAMWNEILRKVEFKFSKGEKVEDIKKGEDGVFTVTTTKAQHRAHSVILALGKGGIPRKLGVKGEELPKVMYRLIEADHYVNKKILVVGGGDSAIEAAMGLANQVGNKVTLSYRKEGFTRIKDRNEKRVQECIQKGKLTAVFNSMPVEFKETSVILEVNGQQQEIPNDFVWVFAGGEPPTAFLKKVGIRVGMHDLTAEASTEVKQSHLVHA